MQTENDVAARDPRLVIATYRAAVALGLMDRVLMIN